MPLSRLKIDLHVTSDDRNILGVHRVFRNVSWNWQVPQWSVPKILTYVTHVCRRLVFRTRLSGFLYREMVNPILNIPCYFISSRILGTVAALYALYFWFWVAFRVKVIAILNRILSAFALCELIICSYVILRMSAMLVKWLSQIRQF